MKQFLMILSLLCLFVVPSYAGLKVIGKGDDMRLDTSGFPAEMKAHYEIMKAKCVKCHSFERIIVAVQTGIAPVSGQPFDRNAATAYGNKMLRKPAANLNKQEVKACVDLLHYLLGEAAKP